MNAETDFKAIWKRKQIGGAPSEKEIINKAVNTTKKIRNKTMGSLLILTATLAFILGIFYFITPRLISTDAGIILICLAIAMYILVSGNLLTFLYQQKKPDFTVKEQLERLLTVRIKQNFLQRQIMTAYFILLSAGLLLYIYEYARLMSVAGFLAAYGITFAWVLFNWWWVRPRTIRKSQLHINLVIEQLTGLTQQLEAE